MVEQDIQLMHGDCLEKMKGIPSDSVDMILQDPPYNTTACKWEWDIMTRIDEFWAEWKRIIKPNGAIVMFGSEPFSSHLRISNLKQYKYDWVWQKGRASGHLHAKNKPMKAHENILVFSSGTTVHKSQSKNRMHYDPQMSDGKPYSRVNKSTNSGKLNHSPSKVNVDFIDSKSINIGTRYPRSVLLFKNHNVGNSHPTQKPIALMEYLIKTYTNEGECIFDGFMGSGTTGVACKNLNRKFIGIEMDDNYFEVASKRIAEA